MKFPLKLLLVACASVLAPAVVSPQHPQSPPTPAAQPPGWPTQPVRGAKAMVVSDEKLASDVGAEIMRRGGNAIDAAVAVGFALAVVDPEAGNIGGGGFMLVRLANGHAHFIDYREVAPAQASRDMYLKSDGTVDSQASIVGYRSVGVPGTVAGLALALKTYGTMKLADVMAPAIHLAEDGFPVNENFAASLRSMESVFNQFPDSRRIFLKNGAYYQPGDIFRQPELAATLKRIAKNGAPEFYRGRTAHDLAAEMKREGGLITLADLARYKPEIREPLAASYKSNGHDWQVITSPPPSSGGVAAIEALNILAPIQLKSWDDPQSVHWVIEAMRRAFADRATYLADPAFAKIPLQGLMSDCYATALRSTIDPIRASTDYKVYPKSPFEFETDPSSSVCVTSGQLIAPAGLDNQFARERAAGALDGNTTHFSVVDAAGNAVANTYTLNNLYGSGVTSADGFVLNDEMDDFTSHPGSANMFGLIQSDANTIAPGKRPLSSMMPTILLRDGQLSIVTGARGGPRIISGTLLTMLNWMRLGDVYHYNPQSVTNAPRFHQQWLPESVLLEPNFPPEVAKDLEARGYTLAAKPGWVGLAEAIGIDPNTNERLGAPDPRRPGAAASGF